MRLTKHRTAILEYLQTCGRASSAQDIHTALPHINLVTIYRNLEAFVTAGIIKKLHLSSTEAVYEYQRHAHHHLVCDDCQKIEHITIDEAKLKEALQLKHFDIGDIDIIVRGKCRHIHGSV